MRDANLKLKWVNVHRPGKVVKIKTLFSKEMNIFILRSPRHSHVAHQFNRRWCGSMLLFSCGVKLVPCTYRVYCNFLPSSHDVCMFFAELSLLYYPSMPPAPPWACFAIAFWCCCINWAGICPSHSSLAREQTSNSTLACSPAEHVMKWPGSVDSPWEGVRSSPAVCHKASWDPGGDPHLFPCTAIGAGLECSWVMGEDSAQAAGKFKAATCAPRRWLRNHGWLWLWYRTGS